jgi:hypothetical protein
MLSCPKRFLMGEKAYVHITIAVDRIDINYTESADQNFFKQEHLIKYSSDAKKYSQSQEYKDFEPKILSVLNENFKKYYKGGFRYTLQIAEDIKVGNKIWDCVINYDGYDGSGIAYTFYTFDKNKRYSVGMFFSEPTSKINPLIYLERLNIVK